MGDVSRQAATVVAKEIRQRRPRETCDGQNFVGKPTLFNPLTNVSRIDAGLKSHEHVVRLLHAFDIRSTWTIL